MSERSVVILFFICKASGGPEHPSLDDGPGLRHIEIFGHVACELFAECVTTGFLFELEVLLRVLRHRYRVEEFPVMWTCALDMRLKPGNHAAGVAKELYRFRLFFFVL